MSDADIYYVDCWINLGINQLIWQSKPRPIVFTLKLENKRKYRANTTGTIMSVAGVLPNWSITKYASVTQC